MTRSASALALLALLSVTPLHAQAARDFQLPPAPATTAETRVQGPVDTDAPVPVRPRVIETARPATASPTTPASAAPTIALPAATPARQGSTRPDTVRAATPRPVTTGAVTAGTLAPQAAPTIAPPLEPAAIPTTTAPAQPLPLPSTSAPASRAGTPAPAEAPERESPLPWLWLALGGAVVAAGAGLVLSRRRRRRRSEIPAIIAPHVPVAEPGEALAIAVTAVRMDRSVLNATVGYRVTIRNRTSQALAGVALEADLVSAAANRPAEQQLATPEQALTPRHGVERLGPGQSLRFEGQVRLPLAEAGIIRQGRVGLLIPLLRVRATAAGAAPVATTLVLGRAEGSTARPQPFRLDEPPRSYTPLAQRVLDGVPARA